MYTFKSRDRTCLEKEGMEGLEMLNLVKMSLQEQPHCWKDCVVWARTLWERLFCQDILQLLSNLPPEYVRYEHILSTLNYFLASCPPHSSKWSGDGLRSREGPPSVLLWMRVHISLAVASSLIKTHSRKCWSHPGGIAFLDLAPQTFTLAASLGRSPWS